MKFFKTKVAIFIIFVTALPIIIGSLCIADKIPSSSSTSVTIYDTATLSYIKLTPEDYLTGVVAAEMPAEFHIEALKAQAVAARTYMVQKGRCSNYPDAAVCTDSSHCQAYKSPDKLRSQWGDNFGKYYNKISTAVHTTENEIIVYKGEPISAVFHSTSSGKTENASDVWGSSRPYLVSVDSRSDFAGPEFASSKKVHLEEFKQVIKSANKSADFTREIVSDIRLTKGGSVATLSLGGVPFKGVEIRKLFGLNSANFTIDIIGSDVIFDVRGYGHGVGMSQYGANFMAEKGGTYTDILKKYYTGVDIVKQTIEYK